MENAQSERQSAIAQRSELAEDASVKLATKVASQNLTLAFEAYNSGNALRCRELLGNVPPAKNSPMSIPWRFLNQRCRRYEPSSEIAFASSIDYFTYSETLQLFAVALSNGECLTISKNGTDRKIIRPEVASEESVWHFVFSNDSEFLAAAFKSKVGGGIRVWQKTNTQGAVPKFELILDAENEATVQSVAFIEGRRRVALIDENGQIKVWDLDSRKVALEVDSNNGSVFGISSSPDGQLLASFGWDGWVRFWDAADLRLVHEWDYGERINSVVFSHENDSFFVSGYLESKQVYFRNEPWITNLIDWPR